MLEAGTVRNKNVVTLIFKNLWDTCIAVLGFYLLGFGFAFGETQGCVIGASNFALSELWNGEKVGGVSGSTFFFFQAAFAGTAITIVSGSTCERMRLEAYCAISLFLSTIVYPVAVHWVWGHGFLSSQACPDARGVFHPIFTRSDRSNGVIDVAGSSVVHVVGGFCGLVGAIMLGPRIGRFAPLTGEVLPIPPHSYILVAFGSMAIWVGFFAFNCGSTIQITGKGALAGTILTNTAVSAAMSCVTCTATSLLLDKTSDRLLFEKEYEALRVQNSLVNAEAVGYRRAFKVSHAFNSLLGGLVAITGSCSVVSPWWAALIGLVAGWCYYLSSKLLLRLKIDDPLDAFPVHGVCGFWGSLAVGIFCTDEAVQHAGYPHVNEACKSGEQFAVQLVGVIVIATWTSVSSFLLYYAVQTFDKLRVPETMEIVGMDLVDHAAEAYRIEADHDEIGGSIFRMQKTLMGSEQPPGGGGSPPEQPNGGGEHRASPSGDQEITMSRSKAGRLDTLSSSMESIGALLAGASNNNNTSTHGGFSPGAAINSCAAGFEIDTEYRPHASAPPPGMPGWAEGERPLPNSRPDRDGGGGMSGVLPGMAPVRSPLSALRC
uniref:Ammonium transporter AmtB-like domain-containing protein n=1 Tax=Hemiselmis andersenii TaxID=464988 RepID=A0A7S1E871_HEMAN